MGGIISRFFKTIVPIEPGLNKDRNTFTSDNLLIVHSWTMGKF
jgi:hypothetical protein